MRLAQLVQASHAVAATRRRLEKIERLADCLRAAGPEEIEIAVALLSGELPGGRVGVGPAALREAAAETAAEEPSLVLADVALALAAIGASSGRGSTAGRMRLLRELLGRATRDEQRFLVRLLVGELRQGALEGVVLEAIARAAGVAPASVRRAHLLGGALPAVARAALREGEPGLARFELALFRPLQPMLASPASDVGEAIQELGRAALEYKLDGARVQVHKSGDEVRVFSRRRNDVTPAVPELVETVRALAPRVLVLDGETLALRSDGRPLPFQVTMRRFGRRLDVEALRAELPLRAFFFDCLRLDGETLLDRTGEERARALAAALPAGLVVPRRVTADPAEAEAFLRRALDEGHEGLVAKSLDAPYTAGRRGREWLKLKAAHTLDLVVLAAEWGHGRRRGWLSNLHLGARDPATGGFAMLGKTFKGLSDAMLAWQTERLLALELARDDWTVHVRPELVVEVAFDEIQASPRYPSGMALRFARVKRHRPDKRAGDADTVETVRALFAAQAAGAGSESDR